MDGAPVKGIYKQNCNNWVLLHSNIIYIYLGETIPIRLFLSGFDLTPTYRDINKKFSTRYYLNLILIDEENRRYFKQQEITIYRLKGLFIISNIINHNNIN